MTPEERREDLEAGMERARLAGHGWSLAPTPQPEFNIQVGPYEYEVSDSIGKMHEANSDSGRVHNGRIDRNKLTILIDREMHPSKQRETLTHEVLHAVYGVAGLAYTHGKHEEEIVERLATHLLDTLRRNPKLVKLLMEGVNDISD